jgi:hypothetical protein
MTTTTKQDVWLQEYLICWNASKAARKAGYSNVTVEGRRNKIKFADEISAHIADIALSADEVLYRLSEQARGEYANYLTVDNLGVPGVDVKKMIADGKGHLIKSVKQTQWGTVIEFHDAQTALLNMGRHHKLFVDRVESSGEIKFTESESAAERISRRIDSIAERLRAGSRLDGDGANGSGSAGT